MQTRREFLRGSAGALAGASAASLALPAAAQASYYHPPFTGRHWVFQTKALNEIAAYSGAALNALSNGDHIFLIENFTVEPSQTVRNAGLNIIRTHYNSSEENLESDQYVWKGDPLMELYDPEMWSNTPMREQNDELYYIKRAANFSHNAGKGIIATPIDGGNPDICQQAAPSVDVILIQAQWRQGSTQQYKDYVLPKAQACRNADSNVVVMSGLATYNNLSGQMTGQDLLDMYHAVRPPVQGVWLNVNGSTGPAVASHFLNLLGPA